MKVSPISYQAAVRMVMENHYSKIMPKLTRRTLGLWNDEKLVGVCTLGWGVRPEHTIHKIFPTVTTEQYHEIGKLCVLDEMPRNTESTFISQVIRWIRKNEPEIKILFSWADAIIGKPGYVYQASNFYFGGHIWTRMYLGKSGERVHRRTMQGLTGVKGLGKMGCISHKVTSSQGYQLWYGMMYRYCFPLCSRGEWKRLSKSSPETWVRGSYPKEKDIKWKQQVSPNVLIESPAPKFVNTIRISKDKDQQELFAAEVSRTTRQASSLQGEVQFLDAAPSV